LNTDFFENQDHARTQTSRLVFLFGLAVLGIMALLYVLAAVVVGFDGQDPRSGVIEWSIVWLDPELMLMVGLVTLVFVGGASLYRIAQLRGGGQVVAETMGGRLLHANSTDSLERVVLNVVEEMSIASGIGTPPVYLMDHEVSINAFAAGYTANDAVIGISRGCAERLSRDELQGVIAHEFSHILNGDMRLNIRLMGVLYGILVIGTLGYLLLRSSFWAGRGSRRNGKDNSAMVMLGVGLALMAIGFIGTFVGNLIKASVSRQREFLADASAVQFTRNPSGIAGALKKIAGLDVGALIENPNAAEASHMFFGRAISSGLNSLFSTHPPLEERIARLDPNWAPAEGVELVDSNSLSGGAAASGVAGFAGESRAAGMDQIGTVTTAHLGYAQALIASLPPELIQAVHEPYGARAVVYALLISSDPTTRTRQLEALPKIAESDVWRLALSLESQIARLDAKIRLPLIDLALPALRELSAAQFERFESAITALAEADQVIDLFEWTLQSILLKHLKPHFDHVQSPRVHYTKLSQVADACSVVIAILSHVGGHSRQAAERAFQQAMETLGLAEVEVQDGVGLTELAGALAKLAEVTPALKRQILTACAEVINADQEILVSEAELFRAIADTLDCPVPPLLPGQPLV
jgi:Zn-dependent protease with chaperone function